MANDPAYTNAARLIDESLAIARDFAAVMNRAEAIQAEFLRVGGEARVSPVFFTLPAPGELRVDMGFSLADFTLAMSAFLGLTGGVDVPAGMAAQISAWRAALEKIKR